MNYLVVEFTFIKEKIAVSGNDGWLARDLDGDGEIDGVAELFGESGDGFADLALLDTNNDGKIDAQDDAYDELLVWQDTNEDGITQDGELLSVANDLFIRELPTSPIDGTLENVTEAAIGQLHIEDIFLNTDNRNAISAEDIPLDFDVIGLPELRGYGRVNNLSQEMSLSTVLKTDVQNLAAWSLEDIFTDFADFRDDFNTVLYKWTGVNDIAIDSRGPNLDDARKLELLEEFDDREFLQFGNVQNSSNPQTLTGEGILRAYDVFEQAVFARFVNQIGGDQLFENDVVYNRFTDEFVIDGAVVLNATLLNDLGTAGTDPAVTDTLAYWKNIIFVLDNTIDLSSLDAAEEAKLDAAIALTDATLDFAGVEASYEADFPPAPIAGTTTDELFNGTALADDISGGGGLDEIHGFEGADILRGEDGNDLLFGGEGADWLIGGDGNDTLDGGTGVGNLFEGGDGDDAYITYLGDNDTIIDTGGNDTVQLDASFLTENPDARLLGVERYIDSSGETANDLVLNVRTDNTGADVRELYVQNFFDRENPDNLIETVDLTGVQNTSGSNNLVTRFTVEDNAGDITFAGRGVLQTFGTDGADTITSAFYDNLSTSGGFFGQVGVNRGEEIYAGAENDTIILDGTGIGDQVNGFGEDGDDTFILRGDGDFNTSLSGSGDEFAAFGGAGNDTFIFEAGGEGRAQGNAGDDTYIYRGGRQDIAEQSFEGFDTIVLEEDGLSFSDLSFSNSGDITRFNFSHNLNNSLLNVSKLNEFENLVINDDLVIHLPTQFTNTWALGTAGDDTITDDIALGYQGNDTLTGTVGDDILGGGDGNDVLDGAGSGSDWLDGGRGDDVLAYTLAADPMTDTDVTHAIGGAGTDTLRINMTSAQFADPDIFAELKGAQSFFAFNTDTTTLNQNEYAFTEFNLIARDIETIEVYVDGVLTDLGPVINSDPVAADDGFSTFETAMLSGNLLLDNGNGEDRDPDLTALSVVAGGLTTANGGTVTLNADGTFDYVAADGFIGQDTFTYTVDDGFGGTDIGTATIDVQVRPNRGPEAIDDSFTLNDSAYLAGNVIDDNGHNGFGVDFDLDRDAITVTAGTITSANGGTINLNADGSFTYNAATGFTGSDSFDYTLTDDRGATDTGTATIDGVLSAAAQQQNGNGTSNVIMGSGVDDTILAFGGNDTIYGGDGINLLNGGPGSDTVDYSTHTSGVTVNLISGEATSVTSQDTLIAVENIIGSEFSDNLFGNGVFNNINAGDGDDVITGNGVSDFIFGEEGNDDIRGGAGGDTIDGGAGNDTINYQDHSGRVDVDLSTGTGGNAGAGFDTLSNIENVRGSNKDDDIRGDDTNNVLDGNSDGDQIRGEGGDDTIYYDGLDFFLDGGDGYDVAQVRDTGTAETFTYNSTTHTGFEEFDLTDGAGDDTVNGFLNVQDVLDISENNALVFLGDLGDNVDVGGTWNRQADTTVDGNDVAHFTGVANTNTADIFVELGLDFNGTTLQEIV